MSFQSPRPTPRADRGAAVSGLIRDYVLSALSPLTDRVARLEGLNRTQSADGLETATLTTLNAEPAERLYQFRIMGCSDCRKAGEGAGAGSGLPVYYDTGASAWLNFHDNASATS